MLINIVLLSLYLRVFHPHNKFITCIQYLIIIPYFIIVHLWCVTSWSIWCPSDQKKVTMSYDILYVTCVYSAVMYIYCIIIFFIYY